MLPSFNVLGSELQTCSLSPLTGWFRDGCCNTDRRDRSLHTICCEVTRDFLDFALSRGNDLITPAPQFNFPGLKPGDRWCLCALRWKEAFENNSAPLVVLEATNEKTLDVIPMKDLIACAYKRS